MQNTLKYYSSRDLRPKFFMCGKGHSFWLEVLNKAITCRVYFYICYGLPFKDVKYSSSCPQTNRELLTVFGSCHCVLYIVSVWGMCVCVCAETFHSTAQASWLETHYIANNGFLFNFPSAGIVDMGYLTLKCISTAGRAHDQQVWDLRFNSQYW